MSLRLLAAAGVVLAASLLAHAPPAHAQVAVIELPATPPASQPQPQPARDPQPSTAQATTAEDEKVMLRARELLAAQKPAEAESLLTKWIDNAVSTNLGTSNLAAEALYLRGNAKLAQDREYDALVDYEQVVNGFPGSEFFARSLERELQVARLYFGGRRRPTVLGLRIDSGVPLAEEIVIRIVERLPGSRLAERALLELGDFYARTRDLRMASEVYDVHTRVFPRSPQRPLAMQRLVYSSIAQFKGPMYDTSVLSDAKVQVERFAAEFPAQAQQTGMTDALAARVDESQAQAMLERARWYITRDDAPAAKVFLQRLVQRHPQSAAAQEALTMLDRIGPLLPQTADSAPQSSPSQPARGTP